MGKKMKPYQKNPGLPKFQADKTDHVSGESKGVSKYDKLVTKNANRSRKKAYRQEQKEDTKYLLNQYLKQQKRKKENGSNKNDN